MAKQDKSSNSKGVKIDLGRTTSKPSNSLKPKESKSNKTKD
ncbi:hypothetical protein [Leeuwenhoekiella marinoflava]